MTIYSNIIVSALRSYVRAIGNSLRQKLGFVFIILFFSFLNTSSVFAEIDLSTIPAKYGEVIYRCREKSPNQLFIIGIGHRDTLSRLSVRNISRIQAEVYKLGEWLIQNEGLELLLPEGFFSNPSLKIEKRQAKGEPGQGRADSKSLDIKTLEEKLSDNKTFINAELLLKQNYPLTIKQVEDKNFYRAVGSCIRRLVNGGNDACDYLQVKSELDYLQERRTAAMLQRIPGIIHAEFQKGNIHARRAIFTMGLSHLSKIIQYLKENRIKIYSPLLAPHRNEDYLADLNLRKENFGVSILIPRTLADDPKILKAGKLDKIVDPYRWHSSARHSGSTKEPLSY
jgi:hypothetical protein